MNKIKNSLKDVVEYTAMAGLGMIVALTVFGGVKSSLHIIGPPNTWASVTVTRMDRMSGGSGVVLNSSNDSSQILTNAHVCEVIQNGGLVSSDSNTGVVVSYKVSQFHDLCLITTNVNMRASSAVAKNSPNLYDDAVVVGHPQLLPTLVQRGMFSHKKVITLLAGFKRCTEEEWKNDKLAPLCFLLGGFPILVQREAQVISAFISPGSSGSPVFNSDNEVSGLVFAGRGDPSYGLIVPLEYINEFLNTEVKTLESKRPNTDGTADNEAEHKLREVCSNRMTEDYKLVKDYCDFVADGIY